MGIYWGRFLMDVITIEQPKDACELQTSPHPRTEYGLSSMRKFYRTTNAILPGVGKDVKIFLDFHTGGIAGYSDETSWQQVSLVI